MEKRYSVYYLLNLHNFNNHGMYMYMTHSSCFYSRLTIVWYIIIMAIPVILPFCCRLLLTSSSCIRKLDLRLACDEPWSAARFWYTSYADARLGSWAVNTIINHIWNRYLTEISMTNRRLNSSPKIYTINIKP